jgi:DNA helicase II / ATP-dependent DNA helicase PcrA
MKKNVEKTLIPDLNIPQQEAVLTLSGPVAVFAGAGSGKTRVITYRIANLLANGISMDKILAVTFTNKAAEEMKSRITTLLGIDIKNLWIGTFHSICLRILRQSGKNIDLRNDFIIFDEEDSLSLIKDCMKELNIDIKRVNPKAILNAISDSKVQLVDSSAYHSLAGKSFFTDIVASVYHLYEKHKVENNALDFDDLIVWTIELFQKKPSVLDHYQDVFEYILVDEYQDVNYSQYILLKILSQKNQNICVVGDDDQSIYSFRGASPDIMLKFQKDYPHVVLIKLEENYRCTKKILEVSNSIVKNNTKRQTKVLWTKNKEGENIHLLICANEKDEAQKVTRILQEKVAIDKKSFNDFVILYRVNAASRNFEEALISCGIPYQLIGGYKFYQRKEVKDFLGYLRVIANPFDRIGLNRVINYPKRNIGIVFINKIDQLSKEKGVNFIEACHLLLKTDDSNSRGRKGLEEFLEMIEYFRSKVGQSSLFDLATELLSKSGVIESIQTEYPEYLATEKIDNLNEVLSAIFRFETEAEDKSLQSFLTQVTLYSDLDQYEQDTPKVTLMTLHSVKGLEFSNVFLVGMEEGLFPHYLSNTNLEALEEERRLCYVGMTRAKDELYLSYAMNRELYGKTTKTVSSRFLKEIPEDLVDIVRIKLPSNDGESISSFFGSKDIPKTQSNRSLHMDSTDSKLTAENYTEGVEIFHKIWGRGIVLGKENVNDDSVLRIHFDTVGERLLNLKYAPIKKI